MRRLQDRVNPRISLFQAARLLRPGKAHCMRQNLGARSGVLSLICAACILSSAIKPTQEFIERPPALMRAHPHPEIQPVLWKSPVVLPGVA